MRKIAAIVFMLCITTTWALAVPRAEYPRPQFERQDWINLNGDDWTYQFDFGKSGSEARLYTSKGFHDHITVPFCPESPLSGVNHKDFIDAMWYHRTLDIPASWQGKHIILHFGGVDFKSTIYINGQNAATHYGGSASFEVDITKYVTPGSTADLVVGVEDDVRSRLQPGGKQSRRLNSYECFYTRVTGIWSTVWLEPVAKGGLKKVKITPDLDNSQFHFDPVYYEITGNETFTVTVKDGNKVVATATVPAANSSSVATTLKNVKTWSPESPHLYNIEFTVKKDGKVIDQVSSYAGMRKSEIRGRKFYLNNKPYYQRLVLDQGYYPDGQWTAPTDEALKNDIRLGKEAGFNGARLHQKVFDQRYFYWADKLGYLTWGESPSWEMDWTNPIAARNMIDEWTECLDRDYNVTSLVVWSPLNEVWMDDVDDQRKRLTEDLYYMTKRIDNTRPVATTSGGWHVGVDDIYTEHTYLQDPLELYNQVKPIDEDKPYTQFADKSYKWEGQPYMIDEFGGIRWIKKMATQQEVAPESSFWGYGKDPQTLEEYYDRLEGQVDAMLSIDNVCGFCYTQIVDVELEKNGIYTYDREKKFDMDRIHRIFTKSREQAKKDFQKRVEARKK